MTACPEPGCTYPAGTACTMSGCPGRTFYEPAPSNLASLPVGGAQTGRGCLAPPAPAPSFTARSSQTPDAQQGSPGDIIAPGLVGGGLCACGCGGTARRKYILGHNRRGVLLPKKSADEALAGKWTVEDTGHSTECWLWTASQNGKGYGQFVFGGKHWGAHRFVYTHLRGPIPNGLTLDHLCRVRHCVNPDHLEPVTNRENVLRGLATRKKDCCCRGHAFSRENTRLLPGGRRVCKACESLRAKAYYARKHGPNKEGGSPIATPFVPFLHEVAYT